MTLAHFPAAPPTHPARIVCPFPLPPILVVDDDATDLYLLADRFRKADVRNPLLTLAHAQDAMSYLQECRRRGGPKEPCLIVIDLRMPGFDGVQLIGWIRNQEEFRRLPIVAVCGEDDPKVRAKVQRAGVTAYYPKMPRGELLAQHVPLAGDAEPR